MSRAQWIIFAIGMIGLFTSLFVALPWAAHHPWLLTLPAFFFLFLMGGTLGWSTLRAIQNFRLRRRGVPAVGRVIHARSSGYTNYVPNWELEVELPGGTHAKLMVLRRTPFTPNEPIALLVDPTDPSRAVTRPAPNPNF